MTIILQKDKINYVDKSKIKRKKSNGNALWLPKGDSLYLPKGEGWLDTLGNIAKIVSNNKETIGNILSVGEKAVETGVNVANKLRSKPPGLAQTTKLPAYSKDIAAKLHGQDPVAEKLTQGRGFYYIDPKGRGFS